MSAREPDDGFNAEPRYGNQASEHDRVLYHKAREKPDVRMIDEAAKAIVDRTLLPLAAYLRRRLPPAPRIAVDQPQVVAETIRRAIVDSADYADANMASALCFDDLPPLWRYAFNRRAIPGLILEFGVYRARSINFFASLTNEPLHGFDSFEGLQEDWSGWAHPKGYFNQSGRLPAVAPHVRLIKGWFNQTLPDFLRQHPEPFSFVHFDCDTYSATETVLDLARTRFVSGTVVLFDEYFGYRGWRLGKFKAWREFVDRWGLRYEYNAFGDNAVLITIL
jgi:hypothetical protein